MMWLMDEICPNLLTLLAGLDSHLLSMAMLTSSKEKVMSSLEKRASIYRFAQMVPWQQYREAFPPRFL